MKSSSGSFVEMVMNHSTKPLFKALSLIILSLALQACTTKTTENTHRSIKDFPAGEQLIIDRTDIHEEEIGIISKIAYRTVDKHQYALRFLPNDIRWSNGDGEPKQLAVCTDGAAYLHFVSQASNPYYAAPDLDKQAEVTDANTAQEPAEPAKVEPYFILKNHYGRFVDKRYFFNWLGEFYWTDLTKDEYDSYTKHCQTYVVPNENYYKTELAQ